MRGLLIVALMLLAGCEQTNPTSELRGEADRAVRSLLKDPHSAYVEFDFINLKKKAICGNYNAKNGFGAYSGKEPFAYVGRIVLTADLGDEFLKMNEICLDGDLLYGSDKESSENPNRRSFLDRFRSAS